MYKGREAPLLHALVFVCPFPGKYGIIAREIPYDVILCHIGLIGATVLKLEGTLESSSTQRWFCCLKLVVEFQIVEFAWSVVGVEQLMLLCG